jgi:hypothetical protein
VNTRTRDTQTVGKVAARVGPLLTIAAAAAAIAGVLLPWAHVTVVLNPVVGSELGLNPSGWSADGPAVVLFGAAAALIGALLLWRDSGRWGRILRLLVLLCGLAVVSITFWDVTHAKTRFSGVKRSVADELRMTRVAPHVHVRPSPWIAISGGGGAALIVAALIDRLIEDEEIVIEDDGPATTRETPRG